MVTRGKAKGAAKKWIHWIRTNGRRKRITASSGCRSLDAVTGRRSPPGLTADRRAELSLGALASSVLVLIA